ncbi:hypothetical protein AVV36_gp074 [Pectobacterium bacteriophage PM2]|uniref:Uncharacterized protein n=1 Tax=Pectobacterium bacteriophage PM2 TaxID=1429794 RepID=A0A0A0Q0C8_9CAUD|nr:hypothetical protein AVV36_gp074 [Pectobacterium bacteriophage PM2]AHY25036.1 hypothetical protein PM2_074 [Pectobacterium bacteriophage PM2]
MSNLNWEEAQQKMREGHRVKNAYFSSEEWFEMDHQNRIVDECGLRMAGWYRNEDWQNKGWAVCN